MTGNVAPFPHFPHAVRPLPAPLGLYLRPGRNDHNALLELATTGDGAFHGAVFDPTLRKLHKELLERHTGRKGPWPLVNVILIQRSGSFAERIGVGFIHEEDWQAAQSKEIFVTLR